MSAVGSRAVMGASRWLEAMILRCPMNKAVPTVIARMANARVTREMQVFIVHLIFQDWDSRSLQRAYGKTQPHSWKPRPRSRPASEATPQTRRRTAEPATIEN